MKVTNRRKYIGADCITVTHEKFFIDLGFVLIHNVLDNTYHIPRLEDSEGSHMQNVAHHCFDAAKIAAWLNI